jgi:hypothetical protein
MQKSDFSLRTKTRRSFISNVKINHPHIEELSTCLHFNILNFDYRSRVQSWFGSIFKKTVTFRSSDRITRLIYVLYVYMYLCVG